MRINSRFTVAFAIAGTLSFLIGCHANNSNNKTTPAQPGVIAQTSTDIVKKCDAQRMELRKTALATLGITALQIESDKVIKEISPDDLNTIVKDGIEASGNTTASDDRDDANAEIADILEKATKAAGIDATTLSSAPGTNPERVIHIGSADYMDATGNFSVGSAMLKSITGIKVGDIYGVVLAVGLNPTPAKSFQAYSIGLQQVTDASTGAFNYIKLSDYVEPSLPQTCQGTKSALDDMMFNTLTVGASG